MQKLLDSGLADRLGVGIISVMHSRNVERVIAVFEFCAELGLSTYDPAAGDWAYIVNTNGRVLARRGLFRVGADGEHLPADADGDPRVAGALQFARTVPRSRAGLRLVPVRLVLLARAA